MVACACASCLSQFWRVFVLVSEFCFFWLCLQLVVEGEDPCRNPNSNPTHPSDIFDHVRITRIQAVFVCYKTLWSVIAYQWVDLCLFGPLWLPQLDQNCSSTVRSFSDLGRSERKLMKREGIRRTKVKHTWISIGANEYVPIRYLLIDMSITRQQASTYLPFHIYIPCSKLWLHKPDA
jgi:hypothetical protein